MKNLLKKAGVGLMVATLTIGAVGCGGTPKTDVLEASETTKGAEEAQEEQITLNVWHQWTDSTELKKVYDNAVTKYMEENPNIKINTQTINSDAYITKIQTEFAGSASGIDSFFYWGEGRGRQLAQAGKLLPLDEYLTEETKTKIKPGALDAFIFDNKTYSLPTFGWYMTLFCNQELFDQAGAKIPTTYEELLEAAKKLSALEGITPIAAGSKDAWNAAFIYEALALREVGAEKIGQVLKGELPFEDAGFAEAGEKVTELYSAGAFGKNPLEISGLDADAQIFGGTAAMRIMGSWFANAIHNDKSSTVQDKMVAAKIPMSTLNNATDYAGGYVESFFANNNTQYKEETAKFTIYINEAIAKGAQETGTGFSGWDIEIDESKLNPLFKQISEFANEGEKSVLAWDTILDPNPATIHVEEVQTLFMKDADVDAVIKAHQEVLAK